MIFFFKDLATSFFYTLSLHDALPILVGDIFADAALSDEYLVFSMTDTAAAYDPTTRPNPTNLERSEEHTSELQSHSDLVCRLLLEKKKRSRPGPSQRLDAEARPSVT